MTTEIEPKGIAECREFEKMLSEQEKRLHIERVKDIDNKRK